MNDIVKTLFEKSTQRCYPDFGQDVPLWSHNIDAFAKAIIDECVRVCSDMANASPEPMRYMECEMEIEKHFDI